MTNRTPLHGPGITALTAAVKGWVQDFGDLPHVQSDWFWANFEGKDKTISEADGITAMEGYMRCMTEFQLRLASKYQYPQLLPWPDLGAAELLLNHRWRPDSVFALLRDSELLFAKEWSRSWQDDDLTPKTSKTLPRRNRNHDRNWPDSHWMRRE